MKKLKRFYYYSKHFYRLMFENDPSVKKLWDLTNNGGILTTIGAFVFALVIVKFFRGNEGLIDAFFVESLLGLSLATFSYVYMGYKTAERLIWDFNHYRLLKRAKTIDKTRFYASVEKSHISLPPAQDISIARIQLGEAVRRHFSPSSIAAMARSLKKSGQLTPIKVRPLTPEEKANDPNHDLLLVGGQIRIRAAITLDWETMKTYVLDLTPIETIFEILADNDHPFQTWVQKYEKSWQTLKKLPLLTLQQYAELNRYDLGKLKRFLDILDLLTPKARQMINESILRNEEEEWEEMHGYDLTEGLAQPLFELKDICHDINLTRQLTEQTVKVIIKHELDHDAIVQVVNWVKAGHYPEDLMSAERPKNPPSWIHLDSPEAPFPNANWFEANGKQGHPEVMTAPDGMITETRAVASTLAKISTEQIMQVPYNQQIIQEGGLKTYTEFIHRCLRLKGLGTSPETNYQWGAKPMMAWYDPQQDQLFPLFESAPGRIEEPVYVFYITQVGDKPVQWVAAAEVDDILRGCHIQSEPFWVREYADCIQKGILDRLEKPEGVWAGGMCGRIGIVNASTPKVDPVLE